MEKEKKQYNKILIVALIFVSLLIVAFFLGADTVSKNGENNSVNTNLNVSDNVEETDKLPASEENKSDKTIVYSFNKNNEESTVFSELINYGKENNVEIEYNNNYSFGVFIESIAGIKNGDDGKYWQYYIDDVLGDVAADKKVLKEGDAVEWRFEEVPF
ncbi:DUF4430 domain-containing protein [Patescibacteria group bacterium]|nr:DUF4430 domain-containing protein [Patescibacteria group bacterium]